MTLIAINATDIRTWLGGEIIRSNFGGSVSLVGTDTRTLPPESCYVAILGERHNGHDFVDDAIARGAKIIVVQSGFHHEWNRSLLAHISHHPSATSADLRASAGRAPKIVLDRLQACLRAIFVRAPSIRRHLDAFAANAGEKCGLAAIDVVAVPDTTIGLGLLAQNWRKKWGGQAVVITGSNGKTTTKEYIAAALETSGTVLRTPGNWNNQIGLPLTIFGLQNQRFAVLEIGTSAPGEIALLADIAKADVAVITNIAAAHLQGLGSIEGVAAEKGALFRSLSENATAIVNLDDPHVVTIAATTAAKKITYGTAPHADIHIVHTEMPTIGRLVIQLRIDGRVLTEEIDGFGRHLAHNAAAAVGAAMALGIGPEVAFAGLKHAKPAKRRLTWHLAPSGAHILDDCYNANPGSMATALNVLANLPAASRRIAVLGDMLELGESSAFFHRQLGALAQNAHVDVLVAVGQFAQDILNGAQAAGFAGRGHAVATCEEAMFVADLLRAGDWLLVKGSRGVALEKIVDAATGGIH